MLFKKLTDYIIPAFTASLVISYFGCYGYYAHFNIDITAYIGIDDLTIIFAKYVWLGIICLVMICYLPYVYFNKPAKRTWWDKTVGGTMVKRRALLIFPILAGLIILAIIYREVLSAVAVAYFIGIILLFLTAAILTIYAAFNEKEKLTEVPARDWITLVAVATISSTL